MSSKVPHANCDECPLKDRPLVRTKLAKKLPVQGAVVARSPGAPEVRLGEPFASQMGSGKILDFLFKMNGVDRDHMILSNVVLCVPPDGPVPSEAIKACAPRLEHEIKDAPIVIAAGSEAVKLLLGGSIDRNRGIRHERGEQVVIATNNPAIVLRDDSKFPDIKKDFKRAFNPLSPPQFPTIEVVESRDAAIELLARIRSSVGVVAADVETRGGLSHKATLISLQLATDSGHAYVIGEREGLWDDADFVQSHLRPLLESPDHVFIWHGGKFDIKILRHTYGINARVDHDTMLLSYALDERSGTDERVGIHGLDYLLMDTFGWPYYSSESVERAKKTGVVEDYDEFYRYAGLDVGGTFQLFQNQLPRAEADGVLDMYKRIMIRATNGLLPAIEMRGMPYDINKAADIHEFELQPELEELTHKMQQSADNPILNPGSTQQMAHLIYDVWGIQHIMQKRRPTETMQKPERSVDDAARKEVIEGRFRFRGDTERVSEGVLIKTVPAADAEERKNFYISFVEKYDRFQSIRKQDSTYIVGLIKRAELDAERRIYTQLNLHGTNSGRLSSSRPNLQNITRTKEGLPDIRKLFTASPGRTLVQADYSQAELRCIAQASGDPELCAIYEKGLSLHKETASRFYGPDYTTEQYSTSKNVNFGVFYGQSAETFQEKHGIPKDQAQAYINWVWKTFKEVAAWEDDLRLQVKTKGNLVSPFGRKRRFHLLTRENIDAAYREGINFYPQSTASDLTLCSAMTVFDNIDLKRANIVILVHDSIVADVVDSYVDEYSTIVQQVMASTPKDELGWTLPFEAEVGVGPDWASAK